ncbi:Hypothetical predicted protein [Paramuricea clavata]|uniref:Uncharacterized protein n=1 Tax=Paramuricea clavata TaxID=317549 RepID=A0A7D9JMJ4_PARCT|nr:Hypothetical predicted protein [Paramuricea clavata]
MRSYSERQKLHKRDGLWGGQERPGIETPISTPHSSKTDGPCCIRPDEKVGKLGYARRQEEADAIPIMKESEPPVDIPTKLDVKANWVRAIAKKSQKINHRAQKPSPRTDNFARVGEVANQRLSFLTVTSTRVGPRLEE